MGEAVGKAALRAAVRTIVAQRAAVTPTLIVRRALPEAGLRSLGPWVFLDHFGPVDIEVGDMGTPPHPHAGISTVTYLFEGGMHHRDSLGHEGAVGPGGAQWMVAGRGIEHAERPAPGRLHGLQLWARLPRAAQWREPAYANIDAATIPVARIGDAEVRLVTGTLGDLKGPGVPDSPSLLAHLSIAAGGEAVLDTDPDQELGVYVAAGSARVAGAGEAQAGELVVLERSAGALSLQAGASGAELIVLGGAPAEQPLMFHGPFVMDSVAALRQAEADYHAGKMGFLPR